MTVLHARMPPLFSRNRAFPIIRALTISYPTVVQVIRKQIIDKRLFGFTFDMDQQPRHSLFLGRSPADLVLLPQLTEAVVFQPSGQFRGFESCQIAYFLRTRSATKTSSGRKWSSRSGDCVPTITCVLVEACLMREREHGDRVGMQSQLWFID